LTDTAATGGAEVSMLVTEHCDSGMFDGSPATQLTCTSKPALASWRMVAPGDYVPASGV
jgi:hypothetical protein